MEKIKNFLIENNFDYFLLPNSDEFFSEYLPQHQKRVEFITGFSGSNATIIFGQNKNFFFTDGRYILQAKQQLDLNEFEIINIAEKSLISWLKDNVDKTQNLALDPKLLSKNFIEECENFLSKITFLQKNPIDEIWIDKPIIRGSQVFSLPLNLVGENFEQKKSKLLDGFLSDAIFISKPENLNWLLNIRSDDVDYTPLFLAQALLFKNGKLVIFANEERFENINLENVEIISKEKFEEYFKKFSSQKTLIQIDKRATNYWSCEVFEKNNIKYFHKNCPIEILKAIKNSHEIIGAKKSHYHDAVAIVRFLFWLEDSQKKQQIISEISAQQKLLEFRQKCDHFLYPSFETISGFEANGAIIHYHSTPQTNKEFLGNSLYLFDSGGQYFGDNFCGTTDITRTIAIGTPTLEMIEDYTRVLKGHIALARIKFPRGTSGSQLDVLARSHLWNAGKNYDHGTGHGVGSFLSVHEGPCSISKNSPQALQVGMILSNEPGFYKEGEYGIRLENLMLVAEFDEKFLCFETLTLAPFDFNLIDFKMLTYPEKKWLAEYHQNILRTIGEELNYQELSWFISNFNQAPISSFNL
jgi:Xaa-Pro aminopeptidase